MKNVKKALLLALSVVLMGWVGSPALAQSDLIFPWVTNNDLFRGRVIITNLNAAEATVTLTAQREATSGDTATQTVQLTLAAFEQRVAEAGALFDQMGDGSAFMVRLTSDSGNIKGAFVNVGTQSSSGSSPSQTNVFRADEATDTWLFNYMFIDNGFSAPVILNLGDTAVDVTLLAFQNGQQVGEASINVAAGHPAAGVVGTLFPDLTGDLYLVAHADGAQLLATGFLFNDLLEPSMAAALPLDAVPNPDNGGGGNQISFANQVQPIFIQSCGTSGCHTDGGQAGGLNLDTGNSYGNIVNVGSVLGNDNVLIIPNNAEASYLYRKLLPAAEGQYFGSRMPRNRTPLAQEQLDIIFNWIAQGAQDN